VSINAMVGPFLKNCLKKFAFVEKNVSCNINESYEHVSQNE
jgi:hypothetical protein